MTGILFQAPSAAGSLTLQERQNVPEVAPSVFSGSINFRVSYINRYFSRDKSNRGGEIRTPDLLVPNQILTALTVFDGMSLEYVFH